MRPCNHSDSTVNDAFISALKLAAIDSSVAVAIGSPRRPLDGVIIIRSCVEVAWLSVSHLVK